MNEHLNQKRRVILVTDGDRIARKAVEMAAENIGARCISQSAGNPSHLPGKKVIELIRQAKWDPIVVMADDKGNIGEGSGEQVIREIAKCSDIEIIGAIAVASNTEGILGIEADFSITRFGNIIKKTVDKRGNPKDGKVIYGDTVDILNMIDVPIIVGIGDPGKMTGKDDCDLGSPIITKAMQEIINRSY
ncbi:MAG: stage sporulation protein [Clostridia bacterium]|jgi:stage V sporulation protein AE|nr:stage sporulation protein [Clostridia bacterium]